MSQAVPRSPVAFDREPRLDLVAPAVRRLAEAYARLAQEADDLASFRLVLDDGQVQDFGSGERAFEVRVNDRAGRAALASLDETKVALAYMDGELDLDGDLLAVLGMRRLLSDRHPLRELWSKYLHPLVFGQTRSDEKWIAEHYDEDADFYLLFLDRHRCYSHGIFAADDEPLDDAILRKLDFALDAVGVEPGQRLLDIGAGWGAMTEHAGRRGIHTTSLTISEPSERQVRALIDAQGLPCRVLRRHFLEYEDEPYDAIVNLGVTEHLPDYEASLAQYRKLLKPGGKLYLDASASRTKFPFASFTYRFIFPGNATTLCLHEYLEAVAQTPFEVLEVHNDRNSYRLTCKAWAENLEAHREEIEQRWGRRLFRRFQLYLWGCVDAFTRDNLTAYRLVLQLPG